MVVCHCLALNDAAIVALVQSGRVSVEAVVAACGAGTECGSCVPLLEEVLGQAVSCVEVPLRFPA